MHNNTRLIALALVLLVITGIGVLFRSGAAEPTPAPFASPISGKWNYRSWNNDPDPVDVDPDAKRCELLTKLLFAEAELVLEDKQNGELRGKLNMGGAGSLTLSGSVAYGSPFSVRFQGVGKDPGSPSEGWVYDYVGWYVPAWPNGVDQKPAIVGSVIRTVPHGQAKAGKVASFIAVKK